jgi:hypothetical protein
MLRQWYTHASYYILVYFVPAARLPIFSVHKISFECGIICKTLCHE